MTLLRRSLLVCLAVTLSAGAETRAQAESFEGANRSIDAQLQDSLRELAKVRDRIAKEKIPVSQKISRLENDVIKLRRERDKLQKVRDARTVDLSSLRAQVEGLEQQSEFVGSRLAEFVRDFEGRLDISELPRYEDATSAAKLAAKNANLDEEEGRNLQLEVVRAAIERIQLQIGGDTYEGEALSPEGVLTAGRFIALGPSVLYASDDGAVAGFVENRLNAADPVVVRVAPELGVGIAAVARDGRGLIPFDATLGKALKVERARKSLSQYVAEGGAVGVVILALGGIAVLLGGFKAFEILRFRVAPASDVSDVLEELSNGSHDAAAKRAIEIEGIAGEMISSGVEHISESRGVLEELLFEKVLGVRPTLERFLPFLAITAASAPLLGLLGTVIGMIKTFQLITIFGTGDAKSLSSGISEALVTTALGLVVAIPTLIVHGALSRMAKRKLGLLEELSVAFINGVTAIRSATTRKTHG